jgi:hypothetical protein
MELIHRSDQQRRGQKPVTLPFHDAPKQHEQQQDHKEWQQVRLPDIAAKDDDIDGCGVEQCGDCSCQPPVVASCKHVGQEYRRDVEQRDQDIASDGIGGKNGWNHHHIDK